jgi:hypothetical protein
MLLSLVRRGGDISLFLLSAFTVAGDRHENGETERFLRQKKAPAGTRRIGAKNSTEAKA